MSTSFAVILTYSVLILDLLLILATLFSRMVRLLKKRKATKLEKRIFDHIEQNNLDFSRYHPKALLQWYNRLLFSVRLEHELEKELTAYLIKSHHVKRLTKQLSSHSVLRRIEAVSKLRNLLFDDELRTCFVQALKQEESQVVSLYLFEALARYKEKKAIIPMISKLRRAKPWMAARYRALLISYAEKLLPYLKRRLQNDRTYLGHLICEYAQIYPSNYLREYLIRQAQGKNRLVRQKALQALALHFPEYVITEAFLESPYHTTHLYVIKAYAQLMDPSHIQAMLRYANRLSVRDQLIQCLSEMSYKNPKILFLLLDIYEKQQSSAVSLVLAKVLDNRLSYLLESHIGNLNERLKSLVERLIIEKHISGLIGFLNTSSNEDRKQEVASLIKNKVKQKTVLKQLFYMYLNPTEYASIGLSVPKNKKQNQSPHQEKPQRLMLLLILLATLLVFPLIILLTELPNLTALSLAEMGALYIVRFNYLLVFYSVTINTIYLLILAISFRASKIQNRLYRAKDKQFLFTKGLLPSISIIAPAYNESASIIESTNSLLNQHYPDFELIVVNDGSKDDTLMKLVSYFNLEKRDILIRKRLKTRELRGIYKNKNIPNLTVVDKVNGGKADSLNTGLNVAKGEYFCGIDADSLLEPDALLKAVSVMLDYQDETIASGGNICPVNGCDVELGSLDSVALPSKFLARIQSLEYIRSFMTGRIGWAKLDLLLIISGAFGIFQRNRTIATGGYLTKSGKYHKDTVGEDMELVVRLSRYMKERNRPYHVQYAGNANCWTEVPQKWKVFRRQRDRWQRGLIDIMMFHSDMVANPRYGKLGMVGMLYYYIFEFIGPLIEAQGLFFVLLAAVFGLLNVPIALLLFTTTILLGILVSLSALFISEHDRQIYCTKDMIRLLGMAVFENFGVRQLISLLRVSAYFSAMRKNRGWGAQVRTGFKASKAHTKTS